MQWNQVVELLEVVENIQSDTLQRLARNCEDDVFPLGEDDGQFTSPTAMIQSCKALPCNIRMRLFPDEPHQVITTIYYCQAETGLDEMDRKVQVTQQLSVTREHKYRPHELARPKGAPPSSRLCGTRRSR